MPLIRISITIPKSLVAALDRRARETDRSRSWVITDAVRRCLEARTDAGEAVNPTVREEPSAHAAKQVLVARQRHLEAEAALSPGERLRRAEELARLARQAQRRPARQQVVGFETYEDYYEWKKARRVGA